MRTLHYLTIIGFLFSCQTNETKKVENLDSVEIATTHAVVQADETITFGFANEKGTKILAFEENINPKSFTQTIDSQGDITPVNFLKTQKANESGVNLTAFNFNNCGGEIFELNGGKKANKDLSLVLFNEIFIQNHSMISVKTLEKPITIDNKVKATIETDRKRTIKNAWKIANLGKDLEAFIVVFTPIKDSVLASLVIGNQQFTYRDYPAKYDSDSTWRVDDGGEFPNDAIRILAVFRNRQGEIEIITEWAGAEGANIEYFKFRGGKVEILKESSRYWGAG